MSCFSKFTNSNTSYACMIASRLSVSHALRFHCLNIQLIARDIVRSVFKCWKINIYEFRHGFVGLFELFCVRRTIIRIFSTTKLISIDIISSCHNCSTIFFSISNLNSNIWNTFEIGKTTSLWKINEPPYCECQTFMTMV